MYQVLYRKWRPQVFSDVVGQNHITETLMGAVMNNRVSHAYLFTGTRGCGKTTCAKILAKAVNCEHPVNGNPCNQCAACKGIDDGSVVDVVEIDAASNNGVDNIRDLREETNYMPSSVKYRVYIIDEVHMLSAGAFNALLKTLEEPPEHVKFILATTEVHKLPATILSRCQRFDFKRISPDDIAGRLKYVASQENIELTDEGAMLIARVADGAMRDALSLLDRCVAYNKPITEELASDAAGIAGKEHIYALVNAMNTHDCKTALNIVNDLYSNSCDMERLFSELISHFRNMMISLTVPNYKELILSSESEAEKIKAQAQSLTLDIILSSMNVLNDGVADLKKGTDKRITAEAAVIRLTSPELDNDSQALLRRISELERKLANGAYSAPVQTVTPTNSEKKSDISAEPAAVQPVIPPEKPKPVTEPVKPEPEPVQPPASQQIKSQPPVKPVSSAENPDSDILPFSKWADALELLRERNPMLTSFLNNATAFVKGNILLIKPGNPLLNEFLSKDEYSSDIKKAVFEVSGQDLSLAIYKSETAGAANNTQNDTKTSPLDSLLERAKGLDIQIVEQ